MLTGIVVDLDRNIAIHSAQTSIKFKLAMADSIIIATAQAYDATLWTQDQHFKALDGVKYIEKKS